MLNAVARLAEIPCISEDLARAIIAETGLEMSRFPTAAHLVSRAGLCPSARQVRAPYPGREERPGRHLAAQQPRPGRHRRRPHPHLPRRTVRPDRPPPRQGQGHDRRRPLPILVIIWHLLKDPEARFADLGYGYYQARLDTDRKLRNHIRQIQALGFDITITKAA